MWRKCGDFMRAALRRALCDRSDMEASSEVDFVAVGDEGEEYYQVAYTLVDAGGRTLKRELAPLDSIRDHNPKFLLTMDYGPLVSHNGIKQIYVLDWLGSVSQKHFIH